MEFVERAHPITLFTHFITITKSMDICRVLMLCALKNQNIVKVMKWAKAN